MHGGIAGKMALEIMLATEAAVTVGTHESHRFLFMVWNLRLYLRFEASKKSESIVNPQGHSLTERVQ